jgi:hypothetical protein
MGVMMASGYLAMKAKRAKDHLDAFNGFVDEFLPKSYTVTTKDNVDTGSCVQRTQFHPWPPIIAMELGEFVYCLRSGLEQLAWNLALPDARRDFPKDICFPVVSGTSSEARRRLRKLLALFPGDVAREIDAVQPNKGPEPPENHALWQLQKLSNIDKHCAIPVHSRSKHIFVPPGAAFNPLPDEDAVEVSLPIANKSYFDFDPKKPVPVELGEWETDWFIPRYKLADIHGFITCTIIPAFLKVDRPAPPGVAFKIGGRAKVEIRRSRPL